MADALTLIAISPLILLAVCLQMFMRWRGLL